MKITLDNGVACIKDGSVVAFAPITPQNHHLNDPYQPRHLIHPQPMTQQPYGLTVVLSDSPPLTLMFSDMNKYVVAQQQLTAVIERENTPT